MFNIPRLNSLSKKNFYQFQVNDCSGEMLLDSLITNGDKTKEILDQRVLQIMSQVRSPAVSSRNFKNMTTNHMEKEETVVNFASTDRLLATQMLKKK